MLPHAFIPAPRSRGPVTQPAARFPCGRRAFPFLKVLWLLLAATTASGQTPEWIWHSTTNAAPDRAQIVLFRKTFRTPPLLWNSRLSVVADDRAEVFLNGVSVATCYHWEQPVRTEVTVRLNQGENVVAVRARNRAGAAGVLVDLALGGQTNVVSDSSWLVATNEEPGWTNLAFNAAHWQRATSLGAHGILPWDRILTRPAATPAEALTVPEGFQVELLRSATPEEGSWICLAFDRQGRLTISPEGDSRPMLRFTFRDGRVESVSPVPAPLRYAMGLQFDGGTLYANARGPEGAGLYHLVDRNENDQFDPEEMTLLKPFQGGSEHGYHAVRLGPDGYIYVINGNGTKVPPGMAANSPHRHYAQDVLSLNPDESREAGPAQAVQCHVLRVDREGKQWQLWAGGMRNAYAFDFSAEGELFTFDSDMEWDWGTPWYRPTRILHLIPGGEYGWRDGTRTWPQEYQDSLPAVLDVGIGSPTGVRFGTRSRFPARYQKALFAMDWSYGRIFAVHLQPEGASYRGHLETFLQGTPLNLTDLDFGPDGALYFITGGRGTQSGLYRVSCRQLAAEAPPLRLQADPEVEQARVVRRKLERFYGRPLPGAADALWIHLGSSDRVLRYAARIALESQDVSGWSGRALTEHDPTTALAALLALARVGRPLPPRTRCAP